LSITKQATRFAADMRLESLNRAAGPAAPLSNSPAGSVTPKVTPGNARVQLPQTDNLRSCGRVLSQLNMLFQRATLRAV
jgi:hypothetical protein